MQAMLLLLRHFSLKMSVCFPWGFYLFSMLSQCVLIIYIKSNDCITLLIGGKTFHDIGLYIWKIFPCICILSSIMVNISLEFYNTFIYY